MAHHKSAKKRIRGNARKNMRNRSYMSMVRTAVKKFRTAIEAGDKENLSNLFLKAQSLLDKAAQKGMIHKKNASRNVSRLTARFTNFEATGGAPKEAVKKTAKKTAAKAKSTAKKAAAKKKKTSKKK